jgi:hypothetical protein
VRFLFQPVRPPLPDAPEPADTLLYRHRIRYWFRGSRNLPVFGGKTLSAGLNTEILVQLPWSDQNEFQFDQLRVMPFVQWRFAQAWALQVGYRYLLLARQRGKQLEHNHIPDLQLTFTLR